MIRLARVGGVGDGFDMATSGSITAVRFALTALVTSLVNLVLNALAFGLVLKSYYRAHPVSEAAQQLHRPTSEIVPSAMVVTSLTMGVFITLVMKWSGARTFGSGLARGALVGFLFWTSVNSGLYASSYLFSLSSILVDTPFSALSMTIAAAVSAWMLHAGGGPARTPGAQPT